MSQTLVANIRSKYPTPLAGMHAAFLIEVANALGLGCVRKDTGTHITLPSGDNVSQDVLMDRTGQAWDILSDGEGSATPTFNRIDPIDTSRYVSVSTLGGGTQTPPPPPTPTPTDLSEVLAKLDELNARLASLDNGLDQLLDRTGQILGRVGEIVEQVNNLANALPSPQPAPSYQGSVFGVKVVLRPV